MTGILEVLCADLILLLQKLRGSAGNSSGLCSVVQPKAKFFTISSAVAETHPAPVWGSSARAACEDHGHGGSCKQRIRGHQETAATLLFLNVALQQSRALQTHVGEEHYLYAMGKKVEGSEPSPPACWVCQMISSPSGAWEGDYVRDEPGQTLVGCVMLGMGSCWQFSHAGALRAADLFAMVASLSAVSLVVGLVCQKEESLELCKLTPVFSLCKRELTRAQFFSSCHVSFLVTLSPQQDSSLEWRNLLISLFPLKSCLPSLPVASMGWQHSPVVEQRWAEGMACVQG